MSGSVSSFPAPTASTSAAAVERLGDRRIHLHTRTDLDGIDGVILPGLRHGDYCARSARRFSPVMAAVERSPHGVRIGICNGFQVLSKPDSYRRAAKESRLTFLFSDTRSSRRRVGLDSARARRSGTGRAHQSLLGSTRATTNV